MRNRKTTSGNEFSGARGWGGGEIGTPETIARRNRTIFPFEVPSNGVYAVKSGSIQRERERERKRTYLDNIAKSADA